jgi:hypothetical protein
MQLPRGIIEKDGKYYNEKIGNEMELRNAGWFGKQNTEPTETENTEITE